MLKNKVFRNASWIIGSKIIQAVLTLIISMLTARFLGPSNFGVINYAASLVSFVTPLMQLGITNVIVREIVDNPDNEGKILGSAICCCLVSAILSILGLSIFVSFANAKEMETIIVCILYSSLLLCQVFEITQYWFQAKLKSKYSSVIMLFAYFATSVYKIILLILRKNVYWFAVSNSFDHFLIAIGLFVIYKKLGGQKLLFSLSFAKRLLSIGKYYIVSSMMVTIFAQTDKIMLKFMLGSEYVGFYSAAVASAGISSFLFCAIIDSFRPIIFENKNKDNEKYVSNLKFLYAIIIFISLLQSVFMSLFANLIIKILYGKEYLSAVPALQVIVWYTTFSYLGAVRNIWILAENKQKYLWIINLSGALLNVILNLILIPIGGIIGAAIASLITQIFTNVIIGFIIKPIRENNSIMIKSLNIKELIHFIKKNK